MDLRNSCFQLFDFVMGFVQLAPRGIVFVGAVFDVHAEEKPDSDLGTHTRQKQCVAERSLRLLFSVLFGSGGLREIIVSPYTVVHVGTDFSLGSSLVGGSLTGKAELANEGEAERHSNNDEHRFQPSVAQYKLLVKEVSKAE